MANPLIDIMEKLGRPKVMVVGDLILDRYVWGNAERISQEAPVLLLHADQREERLGGAASVASMLAALDADVWLAGVLGRDESGAQCRQLLDQFHIDHQLVLPDSTRPSTLKERYIGRAQQKHPQQILRVDYEVRHAIGTDLVDRLADQMESRLDEVDVVLVSDYDKGVCTPALLSRLIAAARKRGKRVLVDPIRGGDYESRYLRCNSMTPNRLEAGMAVDMRIVDVETGLHAAEKLRQSLGLEAGIVTLDRDGMALADSHGRLRHFPVREREVYDITGAGDMVLAVLGMVLAAGFDYPEAIQLANAAGGLEVERIGVATLTRQEIIQDLLYGSANADRKVVAKETLVYELLRHRRLGRKIAFTHGCFDVVHPGSIHHLRDARAQAGMLVVGVSADSSGGQEDRPMNEAHSRAAVLAALDCVDYVCIYPENTPLELIRAVKPDVLVESDDAFAGAFVGKEVVEALGGRLHPASRLVGHSTADVLQRFRRRNVA